MTSLRQQMLEEMQLRGLSSRTQQSYLNAVRQLAEYLREQGLLAQVVAETWRQEWVVDCRPVGKGETARKYLAPYVFRVALSNKRILMVQDGQVTFRYQNGKTRRQHTCAFSSEAFIHRFL